MTQLQFCIIHWSCLLTTLLFILIPDEFQVIPLRFSRNLDRFNPNIPEWREDIGQVVTKILAKVGGYYKSRVYNVPTSLWFSTSDSSQVALQVLPFVSLIHYDRLTPRSQVFLKIHWSQWWSQVSPPLLTCTSSHWTINQPRRASL